MGFWDEVVKFGKLIDDVGGDSHFKFRCPRCKEVSTTLGWTDFPSAKQAPQWYRERKFHLCPYCGYPFGIDPDRAYIRRPDGGCTQALPEVEGLYENPPGTFFVIRHHKDTDIYHRCPCCRGKMCNNIYRTQLSDLSSPAALAHGFGPFVCDGQGSKSMFSPQEILELQLPNLVDSLETAVLPQSVVHHMEREIERERKNQLARLGYSAAPQASGRRIAYRRLTIRTDEVIAEEIIYED